MKASERVIVWTVVVSIKVCLVLFGGWIASPEGVLLSIPISRWILIISSVAYWIVVAVVMYNAVTLVRRKEVQS